MNKARILVIDDEIGICEGIQRALSPEGFQVDTAFTGEEGLSKVRQNGYDIVLLDIMIPGVSGIDLIAAVHEHDPEIVCIIVTGYATVELAVRSIKEGAYDFLTKPFTVDDLLLAVNQGVERRRLSLEAKRTQAAEAEARRLSEEKTRLEELDLAKRQFLRLVTHELQAPIDAIESYLRITLEGYVPSEKLTEIINKCIARAREERALINDLLELGHLEAIGAHARIEPVRLDEVLRNITSDFEKQAEEKRLRFTVSIATDIPPVSGTQEQFKSMWANLISNAIKYTPKNGAVTVSLHAEGRKVIGEVSDTGIGIPPEDRPRLFTEFFRARNARELEAHGTGLGLVLVKKVVEGAGGVINLESELEHGSKFTFTIPAVVEEE